MRKENWETGRTPQLYTSEQKKRRDESIWTLIQGILAPIQFIAFAVSTLLVIYCLWTGQGYQIATVSVLVKTALLLTIMVTGAIWEKVVFGQYLLAPAFFWEDIVSFFVIFLHVVYVCLLWLNYHTEQTLMIVALVAYFAYIVNAGQFLMKFRTAKIQSNLGDSYA